ncbi:MAG: flagellar biosynthetic protein FliO [Gammaproteobacteria bacterium]|nr:flagellar biosynthetic protein FliO [Gammaproteobacteria bacterium]MBU2279195.1 flagellar biosynthetic protein FliO [Gammaproteobacteria bacterium]MBU2426508.1 flagellar biosynthetic protein FliO [Gammaproteobacteria bacterium]
MPRLVVALSTVLAAAASFEGIAQQTATAVAKETAKVPAAIPGIGQIVISLALVIGLVLLLAFVYKKMQLKMPGSKHFRVVATLNVGTRERLLVIEMQGKQRVIGVTAHNVNFLFELETPLTEEKLASDFHTQLQSFLKK